MTEERLNSVLEEFLEREFLKRELGYDNSFLHDLPILYKITEIVCEILNKLEIKNPQIKGLTKMDITDKITLVKEVLASSGIDINVDEVLNNGTLNAKYSNGICEFQNNIRKYFIGSVSNKCKNYSVDFPNSGYAIDAIVLSHELGHYVNNPDYKNNSLLDETTSIYLEENMLKKFEELGLTNEIDILRNFRNRDTLKNALDCKNTISILITYITFGKVTKENYNKLFRNNDYDILINEIKKDNIYKFIYQLPYVVGTLFSSYFIKKIKEDPSFKFNVNMFSKNIYNQSFEECLSIVDINLSELKKLKDYLENNKTESESCKKSI